MHCCDMYKNLGKRKSAPFRSIPNPKRNPNNYFKTTYANRQFFKEVARNPMMTGLPGMFQPTGTEIKAIDIPLATRTFRLPSAASNIILLNGIQAGTGFFNRVGSRIEMKNLHIRGTIQNSATAVAAQQLRILVIYDRQPTGALPVISDILQTRDQAGAATTSGLSEINLDNRDRFVILRDYNVFAPTVTNTAGVQTNGPQYPGEDNTLDLNLFIKLKGLGTHYKSTSAPTTITDIATGALYCAFTCDQTDNSWISINSFRLRYDDK